MSRSCTQSRVYPRVCGGTVRPSVVVVIVMGLSPRVRGNLDFAGGVCVGIGSIPACAGEPGKGSPSAGRLRVYPPRVRGNQHRYSHNSACFGSIPACAGEPAKKVLDRAILGVYPRVCGGTDADRSLDKCA